MFLLQWVCAEVKVLLLETDNVVAAAWQVYYTARILHLVATPAALDDRKATYSPAVCTEVLNYSRKVVSNSITNRSGAAWANAVQLLSIAGQCLVDWRERKACLQVLRDIRRVIGWNTRLNENILLRSWSWTIDAEVESNEPGATVAEQMQKLFMRPVPSA
jgi:hypothetical protein